MGMTSNCSDDVALFNNVCRKGGLKDAEFLTTLNNSRMQYFKLLFLLFGVNVKDRPLPAGPSPHVDASRFWAVVIRIDQCHGITPLKGCVRDTTSFQQYLTDCGVPKERIQLILDVPESPNGRKTTIYPSRAHITTTLLSLIHNPEIKKGDNIIIYYVGHGSSYQCSDYHDVKHPNYEEEFPSTGYIEALCPIDRDTCDADGNIVPDISNREFNTILTLISQAKGHHITVILDCCHSAGVSREVPPLGAR
ncbi:uncharacterized protein ARMOST_21457 [Armillaria ostoyae]|uniref:Peptidase C14 caspase domain-containing protein n=1 Tax=Armillaria ostoyae TaxID=47428 RepID=A0A284SA45_ARMOS|nr:uncharacterized protein ARMOST_21457 [Armillaria ostoyae]